MRISLCLHTSLAYGGGGEKWAWSVAKYLKERGYEVIVRALPYTPHGRRVVDPAKVLGDIPYYEAWIHTVDADVAYIFYNPFAYTFFKCTKNCTRIAGMHSNVYFLPRTPPITYGIPAVIARLLYKVIGLADLSLYDAVHVVNKAIRVRHPRVFYIPLFIDTNTYRPLEKKQDKFTVLFVGRPSWQKGWDIFVQVAKILKKRGVDIEFLCVGCTTHGPFIRGLGYIDSNRELAKVYSSAHVTLYPSRSDTFGLVMAESLACCTPVITTPIETHMSLELPLIYASTVEEFAEKVLEVKELYEKRPEDYQRLADMGRRAVVERYDAKKVLQMFESMIVSLAVKP